ncbi:MAG: hypothetical protein ACK44D_12685 [Bacteroidia bacterium]|jgi:hypothetical protein
MKSRTEQNNKWVYIAFLAFMLSIFGYANYNGWRIYNSDEVEHSEAGKTNTNSRTRFYHK